MTGDLITHIRLPKQEYVEPEKELNDYVEGTVTNLCNILEKIDKKMTSERLSERSQPTLSEDRLAILQRISSFLTIQASGCAIADETVTVSNR